jgi:uncharacterized membrane protein YjfL (UPF0719 family)
MKQLREYGIYIIFIVLGIAGVVLSEGRVFGEYLSLFVFKPGVKMLMVFLVAQYSFSKISFQDEIKNRNTAAGLVFLGICLVIAEAM